MSRDWIKLSLQLLAYGFLQVFVLKHIHLGQEGYDNIQLIVYPIVLLLIPFNIPHFFVIALAFFLGLFVDLFYHSPGVHAGACLWMVVLRPLVLKLLEPKNGYTTDQVPYMSVLGLVWFVQYVSILLSVFFISYFTLQIFTFVFIKEIIIKSFLSFGVSILLIFLIQILINPQK